jgi:hypothetical protein
VRVLPIPQGVVVGLGCVVGLALGAATGACDAEGVSVGDPVGVDEGTGAVPVIDTAGLVGTLTST